MNKLVRKISPASVCPELLRRLDVDGAPQEIVLYDLYGIATAFRKGQSDKGDWLQFRGQFEAQTVNGEMFVSGACFLPQPFEDMLFSQLSQAQEDNQTASVQFGVRVSIVAPPKGKVSATGYQFSCIPLLQREESPLDSIRALVDGARSKLALPANTSAPKASGKVTAKA